MNPGKYEGQTAEEDTPENAKNIYEGFIWVKPFHRLPLCTEMKPISKLLMTYRYTLSILSLFLTIVSISLRITPSALCCHHIQNFGFISASLKSRSTYDIPVLTPSSLTGSFSSASKVGQPVAQAQRRRMQMNQRLEGILTEREIINSPSRENCISQR